MVMWTVEYFNHSVKDDVLGLPEGIRANFNHVAGLLIETGRRICHPGSGVIWAVRFGN